MVLNDKNIKKAKKMLKVLKLVKFKNFKKEQERLSAIKQAEKVIADYESLKGAKKC